jgi:hypothetical protein
VLGRGHTLWFLLRYPRTAAQSTAQYALPSRAHHDVQQHRHTHKNHRRTVAWQGLRPPCCFTLLCRCSDRRDGLQRRCKWYVITSHEALSCAPVRGLERIGSMRAHAISGLFAAFCLFADRTTAYAADAAPEAKYLSHCTTHDFLLHLIAVRADRLNPFLWPNRRGDCQARVPRGDGVFELSSVALALAE